VPLGAAELVDCAIATPLDASTTTDTEAKMYRWYAFTFVPPLTYYSAFAEIIGITPETELPVTATASAAILKNGAVVRLIWNAGTFPVNREGSIFIRGPLLFGANPPSGGRIGC
jgi:hypothetical protein